MSKQGTSVRYWSIEKVKLEAVLVKLFILVFFAQRCCLADNRSPLKYVRPAPSPVLDILHPLLSRKSKDPHRPEQVHLALAGPGRVAISWVSNPQEDDDLAKLYRPLSGNSSKHKKLSCTDLEAFPLTPTAQAGLSSGNYSIDASGSFTCYSSEDYLSGALHTVLLGAGAPLDPANQYYYRVGDPKYGWSDEFSFVSPPPVGPDSVPYKLGLIGDLGQTKVSAQTLQQLEQLDVASVLDVGDLSYADSNQPRWDTYGRLVEFHTAKVPWMHIEGNHEEEFINGKYSFTAYDKRFWFPATESGSGSTLYYSYEIGPLHVVMLGSYTEYLEGSAQAEWLLGDLAAVDRARTPWVVVGMHAPWYNSNTAHQGEVLDMRQAMEPVLYQHGVDVVFAGHVHAYERSKGGIYESNPTSCAPLYVTIGDGGNREGLSPDYLAQPEWSEFREASYGLGLLTVENSTHAHWEWYRDKDSNQEVGDEYWLVRNSTCTPAKEIQRTRLSGLWSPFARRLKVLFS